MKENDHYYYIFDGATGEYDIYDYKTDQFKETFSGTNGASAVTTEEVVTTTEETQPTTEAPKEDSSYKAVKKAEEFPFKVTFTKDMSNDVTGKWRLSEIDEKIDIQDYAISYYKSYFKDPSEVHIIINYARNTTTCITSYGNLLFVDLYDLVSPADRDAKKSLGGTPLASYQINLDTGKTEKIE